MGEQALYFLARVRIVRGGERENAIARYESVLAMKRWGSSHSSARCHLVKLYPVVEQTNELILISGRPIALWERHIVYAQVH